MALGSQTAAVSCIGCLSAVAFDAFRHYFSESKKQKQANKGEPSESNVLDKGASKDEGPSVQMDTMEDGSLHTSPCRPFLAIPIDDSSVGVSLHSVDQTELTVICMTDCTISTKDTTAQLETSGEVAEVHGPAEAKELVVATEFKLHAAKDSPRSIPIGRLTQKGGSLQDILAARRAAVDDDCDSVQEEVPRNDPAPIGKLQAEGDNSFQSILKSRRAISDTTGEIFEDDEKFKVGHELAFVGRSSFGRTDINESCQDAGATDTIQQADLPIALLFPNQGSEVVGMLGDAQSFPPASALLNKANAVLGFDLAKICSDNALLTLPQHSHPALYVAELVAVERLRLQQPQAVERCSAVAGIGLGEFAALVVADALDFEAGLKLVRLRAEIMHAAAEKATGKLSMLCVVGIPTSRVSELCMEALIATGDDGICEIVSILMPETCTCAGSEKAIAWLKVMAERSTSTGRKISAKFLAPTNGEEAFQTSMMMSARHQLQAALSEVSLRPPRCSIYFNSTGLSLPAGSDPEHVIELLGAQLTSTILWLPAIEQMIKDGIGDFFELGPGRKLRTIMQRINSEKWRRTKCISPCGPSSLTSEACGGG
eukprot:gnl/MRDRNA2_/MRDRNA2_76983_c0_seq1.p1 gnl/MRDRNA2_/MRDRNA2_76983_c0~~gnl/MRDRNA2_/MRDRNA2_76983_c0_seq1.p1  ORF type:complete len:599 (+),score=127.75 gnl/MRDRNA2_/MRDRNA2_76983_c0_seq1:83-1879(+)